DLLADFLLDLTGDVFIVFQELFGVLTALANALALVAEPGAGFLHDIVDSGEVEHVAFARDAFAVHDVEFGLAEGRGGLVLHDLYFGARADDRVAIFDGGDAANIHAHGGIKLERSAAGSGLGIAEHHADLFPDLI